MRAERGDRCLRVDGLRPCARPTARDVRIPGVGGRRWPKQFYRTAFFVDKVLKGTNPATMPIERPTRFELAVNLKTARAIGLAIPPSVLAQANVIVE